MGQGEQLMARLRAGDEAAFEQLVLAYRAQAVRRAQALVRDQGLAEEVAQDAFADLYLARTRYHPALCFEAFFFTLVRRRAIDVLRARGRRRETPWDQEIAGPDTPESLFIRRDEFLRLLEAIGGLNPAQRKMIVYFARDGRSYKEIARRLGLTVPQVKIALHRARQKLKEAMKDE